MLGSVQTSNATFYATNGRVVRHKRGLMTEKLDDVSYPHISSTSLERRPNENLLAAGIAILAFGLLVSIAGPFLASDLLIWGLFLMIIGVLVVFISVLYKTSFWQIKVVGLSAKDLKRWSLNGGNREETEGFARLIQDQIRPRSIVEREREFNRESLIQREIVKVRCQHCGNLNLESSQACGNCGARV